MKKAILFIEDNEEIMEIYQFAFKQAGFEVETAVSGNEVLLKIEEIKQGKITKPDVILLDLILPDMSGLDILKVIRGDERTKDISVFILTNYSNDELRGKGYDLGTEKYLIKTDYTPSQLVKLLEEWFLKKA